MKWSAKPSPGAAGRKNAHSRNERVTHAFDAANDEINVKRNISEIELRQRAESVIRPRAGEDAQFERQGQCQQHGEVLPKLSLARLEKSITATHRTGKSVIPTA